MPDPVDAAAGALDPEVIARLANAFFTALPSQAVPPAGPGAALPSAVLPTRAPTLPIVPPPIGVPPVSPVVSPVVSPDAPGIPPGPLGAPPLAALHTPPVVPAAAIPGAAAPTSVPLTPIGPAVSAPSPGPLATPPSFVPTTLSSGPSTRPSAMSNGSDSRTVPPILDLGLVRPEAAAFAAPEQPGAPAAGLPYFLADLQPRANAAAPAVAPPPSPHAEIVWHPDLSVLRSERVPDLGITQRPFDPLGVRGDFPILNETVHGKRLVWLDNGATTQKPQAVIDRLSHFYAHENSNIHRAAHTLAARATDAYEAAREKLQHFLGAADAGEIVFVRGATEAINLVAKAWGPANLKTDDEIVITWLEHHANIVPWQQLCALTGAKLRVAPVDDTGQVLLAEYEKFLGPRTKLVAFTEVSNALGTITPVAEMTAMAHAHGARVLVDGAQAVSHRPVNVQATGCDFYVLSGHKMFGPTGIGVLYGRKEVLEAMPPWQGGGNMIADVTFERTVYQGVPARFEAGTGNIADAVGLGAAVDYLQRIGMPVIDAYEHGLLAYATERLHSVPGLTLIGTAAEKAAVLSFVLEGCRSEEVGTALDRDGIAVRVGHHCAQPILRRFGLESTVRASLAFYNTCEDIDALVDALLRIRSGRGLRP